MKLEQLKKLISKDGESQRLEFKKSTSLLKPAFETVCAYLNSKGGIIVFGAKDNGELIGQEVSDNTKRELANEVRKIEPSAPIEIHYFHLDNNRQVIALEVPAGKHAPYAYDGRPFERTTSSTSRMTQHHYEQLIIKRGQQNHSWDKHYTEDYNIDDLDKNEILNMVQDGVDQNRISAEVLNYSIERILQKLGLMQNNQITNAAAVLFAKDVKKALPQCTIKLARFRGNDKTGDFIDNQRFSGNAFHIIKTADAFAARHLPISSYFKPGSIKRIDQPAVPTLALREALINSICHKDYSIHSSAISLAIYDNRLELWNAGKLSPPLKLDDLRISHDSYPRNEKIASVFYQRGWIEMWGTGTTRMIDLCKNNDSPEPQFSEYSGGFAVVFPFKEPMHTAAPKIEATTFELTLRQKEIISLLDVHGEMSLNEIHQKMQNPPAISTLRADLTGLKFNGILSSRGKARSTTWFLIKNK